MIQHQMAEVGFLGDQSPRPPGIYRLGPRSKIKEAGGLVRRPPVRPRPGAGAQVASRQSLILLSG
jgi:hypothetical protein